MQKLTIEGFLGIQHAEIVLHEICVIIGPQAAGKSVIARLFFSLMNIFQGLSTHQYY